MAENTRNNADRRRVLISGASIAGPALAFWLDRYGFDVTVVERAPGVRSGGYPIDIRGTALDVVERMGLLEAVQAAHIDSRKITFVDATGRTVGAVPPEALTGSEKRDIELPRGTLTSLLSGLTRNSAVRYRFEDSIESLDDTGPEVAVRFRSGAEGRFDVVVGADGLHSRTRALAFGPEEPFRIDLGHCFNLFTLPNTMGLAHETVTYAEPGRAAGIFVVKQSHTAFAFLIFATETAPFGAHPDVEEQRQRTERLFAGLGWEVPRLLEAMRQADDLYFDTVSQIRMPVWSKGRIGLVGDAAFAPSFLSGQGSSLALVGAYVLAGELATHAEPAEAFAAYERIVRPFVEANQALATGEESSLLLPRTADEIAVRNRLLATATSGENLSRAGDRSKVYGALRLPDYPNGTVG